jgi:hypothetical protein
MLRLMEVFGRVLARRGIATANMTARSAFAKLYPNGAFRQALLARGRSFLRRKIRGS